MIIGCVSCSLSLSVQVSVVKLKLFVVLKGAVYYYIGDVFNGAQ